VKARGQAVQAFGTLVEKVQEFIRDTGGMRPLRQALLKEALTGFSDISREVKDNAPVDRHLATAYQHMSQIATDLGQTAKSREYILRSVEINERVARENPGSPLALARLGITLTTSARQSLATGGDVTEARKQLNRAVDCLDRAKVAAKLMQDDPERF